MAEWSKIDYLLAQNDDEVLHVGKDGTRYNGGTFSPWIGCDKGDRAGCAHCWAEMWARRNPRFRGHWGKDAPRYFFGEEHWQQPLRWQRKCERLGVRKRVLVSLCDPFEALPETHQSFEDMAQAWIHFRELIRATPNLDWLLLTKRPENILSSDKRFLEQAGNLWLGVSAWDQAGAKRMIPPLLEVPAALHWVSLEPLLGPVDAAPWLGCCVDGPCPDLPMPECATAVADGRPSKCLHGGLDWVMVGCESRGARPGRHCDREWVHNINVDCHRAGVPCFTKQLPDDEHPGRLVKSAELREHGWPVQMPRKARP